MDRERPSESGGTPTGPSHQDPFELAVNGFLEGLPLLAWKTDTEGHADFLNSAWIEYSGRKLDSSADGDPFAQIQGEDRSLFDRACQESIEYRTPFHRDLQFKREDGQVRWLACFASPFYRPSGDFGGLIGLCLDLTDRRQREDQLAFMATHDSLTGLPNRRMFESTLGRAVSRASRGNHSMLLMLDIDRFKSYNDAFGHLEGDQALVNLSLLLQRHVRAGDLLARIGGDEFAVLFETTELEEAQEIAERMRRAASEEEFVAEAHHYELGISAGLVPIDGTLDTRSVFDLADAAMYEAKERGRNLIVVKRPGDLPIMQEDRMAFRVRDALADKRFTLYFQPVMNLADGSVAYFESLVRMLDSGGEVSMPGDFLTVVGRLGLMPRLTRLVVGMVLHALANNPGSSVSMNLGAGDLADDSLPRFVHEEMRRQGVEPERMVFEISEGAVMGNLAAARNWIDRLGRLGCTFVLDEFGAGLGLFGLLRELDFDQVKLDGSIVAALAADGDNTVFVEAVRSLIESQGREAVASWVESAELLDRVRSVGFTFGQGYHLEVPSPNLAMLLERYR